MTGRARVVTAAAAALALALGMAGWAGLRPAQAAGRTWTTQLTLSDLHSITCPSSSDCLAVGSNATAPVLYQSTDGGQTWNLRTVASSIGYLQAVFCQSGAGSSNCWAVGTAEAGTGATAVIYASTDGGNTWPSVRVTGLAGRLNAIACPGTVNTVTCTAVGSTNPISQSSTGTILRLRGDLSSVTSVAPPAGVTALTGIACQGSSNCLATGLTAPSPSSSNQTGTLIASANGGATWATTRIPSDVSGLAGLACPASGNCAAAGYAAPSGGAPGALVISGPATAVSWTREAHLSGVGYLDGIACPAAHTCLAAGYAGDGAAAAAKLAWTANGTTWSTQGAGAGYLDGVACLTTSTCWAAGYQAMGGSGSGEIEALTLSGAAWTVQTQLSLAPRAGLTGVSCADQTHCVAVGNSATGPVILASTDGVTWHSELPPQSGGVVYHLDAVACPSTLDCVAVGYEVLLSGSSLTKMAISISTSDGTTWSQATVLSGVSHFDAVTCPSTGRCVASGTAITNLATSGFTGIIDTTTTLGSTWLATTVPATAGYVTGVSCAPATSTCAAVGGTQAGVPLVLSTTTGTSWTIQTLPSLQSGSSYSDLNAVSCATKASCIAVGDQLVRGTPTQGQAVILSGSGTGLTTWALQSAPANTGPLRAVSCATAVTCEAAGTPVDPNPGSPSGQATVALSTASGGTWTADMLPTNVPLLRAVSCAAGTSACRAAGTSAIIGIG